MSRLVTLYRSTLGKKAIVAVTGLILVLFLLGHAAGNLKVFLPSPEPGEPDIDVYAEFLRTVGAAGQRPGELSAVGALAVADDGSLLVADGRNRIDRFHPGGALLDSWGRSGSGVGEFLFGGGRGNDAGAGGGLATANGMLYVADSGNDRIQKFDSSGNFLQSFGSRCTLSNGFGCVDPDGSGPLELGDGQFSSPLDVAVDSSGNIYVIDEGNQRI